MNLPDIPVLTLPEAGARLAALAKNYDFAFFEYWLTDYAGHGQDLAASVQLLEQFDLVLGGLLADWGEADLLLLTSDHGNLEDLSTRRHTANPVPLLLVGQPALRRGFDEATDLTAVAPGILRLLGL